MYAYIYADNRDIRHGFVAETKEDVERAAIEHIKGLSNIIGPNMPANPEQELTDLYRAVESNDASKAILCYNAYSQRCLKVHVTCHQIMPVKLP